MARAIMRSPVCGSPEKHRAVVQAEPSRLEGPLREQRSTFSLLRSQSELFAVEHTDGAAFYSRSGGLAGEWREVTSARTVEFL